MMARLVVSIACREHESGKSVFIWFVDIRPLPTPLRKFEKICASTITMSTTERHTGRQTGVETDGRIDSQQRERERERERKR